MTQNIMKQEFNTCILFLYVNILIIANIDYCNATSPYQNLNKKNKTYIKKNHKILLRKIKVFVVVVFYFLEFDETIIKFF